MYDFETTINNRLQIAIGKLGITPYALSKKLNYKSPDTVYTILNSKSNMSENFLIRLEQSDLPINIEWLKKGIGDPINLSLLKGGAGNEITCKNKILFPGDLNFDLIKKIATGFAKTIGIEENSYLVKVKRFINFGLEFQYTTFQFEDEDPLFSRQYTIALSPDWDVVAYFDFWGKTEGNYRGQDLLKLNPNNKQKFINAINPVQKLLMELISYEKNYDKLFPEGSFLKNEDIKTLYVTDPRISSL
jgi:hypothetical protein